MPMNFLRKLTARPSFVSSPSREIKSSPAQLSTLSIEDFNFIRTLGTGSFGRVYLAKKKPNVESGEKEEGVYAIKRLKKAALIKQKQVDHITAEKNILSSISHPFCIRMFGTFKDDRYLYLVMNFVVGGEFFTFLRKKRRLGGADTRFYAAQVVSIFEYLHSKNIIYRDLKPENMLLSSDGYLKLTDFGFAKVIEHRTYTLCGTPEYIAPEVLLNKGHGKPVDWWTLGILIFEMHAGSPPFVDDEPMGIYKKILAGRIVFPRFFESDIKSLVRHLLSHDLTRRYGNLKNGVADIKQHRWFYSLSWSDLLAKRLTPPHIPNVKAPDDASNFESYPESKAHPASVVGESDPFLNW